MKSQLWLVSIMVASFGASAPADDQTKTPTAPVPAPAPALQQSGQALKPGSSTQAAQLSEVARMSAAGVNENVILTYIDKPPRFALAANDLLTPHDQVVSLSLTTAMSQHPPGTQLPQAPTPPASLPGLSLPLFITLVAQLQEPLVPP